MAEYFSRNSAKKDVYITYLGYDENVIEILRNILSKYEEAD